MIDDKEGCVLILMGLFTITNGIDDDVIIIIIIIIILGCTCNFIADTVYIQEIIYHWFCYLVHERKELLCDSD